MVEPGHLPQSNLAYYLRPHVDRRKSVFILIELQHGPGKRVITLRRIHFLFLLLLKFTKNASWNIHHPDSFFKAA